jgi:hypothetical protein
MATVDVWVAIFDVGTQDQTIVGVYTSEERALAAARCVSPESAEAVHWVLDEVPDWVDSYEYERDSADEDDDD